MLFFFLFLNIPTITIIRVKYVENHSFDRKHQLIKYIISDNLWTYAHHKTEFTVWRICSHKPQISNKDCVYMIK